MKKSNIVIGSILIVISSFVWIYTEVAFPVETNVTIGSPFFPRLLAVVLAVLAVLLMLQKTDREEWKPSFKNPAFRRVMVALAACAIYVALLKPVGFLIMASLLMIGLMYLLGYRKYLWMALISIGVAILVQIAFEKLLGVVLPYGVLAFIFYA